MTSGETSDCDRAWVTKCLADISYFSSTTVIIPEVYDVTF